MNPRYGINRSVYTGRFPRSLSELGWSATFDPPPGLWQRFLKWIVGF